jgi:hypothetical protein
VAFQTHGNNASSAWFFVRPETTRSSTPVNHAGQPRQRFDFVQLTDTINIATIGQ